MKIQQFLDHHGLIRNPFADEDAQIDAVFKDHCINTTYHPTWDKVFGDPSEPSTAIVFGEKGSGKTALRLQIDSALQDYCRKYPDRRVFVIQYDDFNPFLDRFCDRMNARRRRADRVLAQWMLWDHMDAILSLGVTQLVNRVLCAELSITETARIAKDDLSRLNKNHRRDLLLLTASYDQSSNEPPLVRWNRLRRKLGFWQFSTYIPLALGGLILATVIALTLFKAIANPEGFPNIPNWLWITAVTAGFVPWLWKTLRAFWVSWTIRSNLRVSSKPLNAVQRCLMRFTAKQLAGQPLPNRQRTDDRYELLGKLQGVLKQLRYHGVVVLVDRLDEPHLINGSADLMRAFLWPMLDNKFLKHPGMGLKLLLPEELSRFIEREEQDFFQRARLDKQNMVPSLQWSPEALVDVTNDRLAACCAKNGSPPNLQSFFDDSVSPQRLTDALRSLRVPRHLFKFLYRLMVAHCNSHTDQNPDWKIGSATLESELAVYSRDQDAADRGAGTV